MNKIDPTLDPKVTRFEVIDEDGRAYVRNNIEVRTSRQDDDRTLKIFVSSRRAVVFRVQNEPIMVQDEDLGDV